MLDLPRGTINSRLRRALDRLSELLDEEGADERGSPARGPEAGADSRRGGGTRAGPERWSWRRRVPSAPPEPQPPRHAAAARLELAVALGLIAALVSPAGAAIQALGPRRGRGRPRPSLPALTSLPAAGQPPGRLASRVPGSSAPTVRSDCSGTTSQSDLVAARPLRRRHQPPSAGGGRAGGDCPLDAVSPGAGRDPVWSPDGYRIAYLDGEQLRVVAGDGTGDRPLANTASRRSLRPGSPAGSAASPSLDAPTAGVRMVVQADSGRPVFAGPAGARRRRLGLVGRRRPAAGRELGSGLRGPRSPAAGSPWRVAGAGGHARHRAALSPERRVAAVAVVSSGKRRALLLLRGGGRRQRLFAGLGSLDQVVYSPDGDWLLVPWRSADQWLFLSPSHPPRRRDRRHLRPVRSRRDLTSAIPVGRRLVLPGGDERGPLSGSGRIGGMKFRSVPLRPGYG